MLLADPEVALTGIPAVDAEGTPFASIAADAVDRRDREHPAPAPQETTTLVSEAVGAACAAAINQAWGKKPQSDPCMLWCYVSESADMIGRLEPCRHRRCLT